MGTYGIGSFLPVRISDILLLSNTSPRPVRSRTSALSGVSFSLTSSTEVDYIEHGPSQSAYTVHSTSDCCNLLAQQHEAIVDNTDDSQSLAPDQGI